MKALKRIVLTLVILAVVVVLSVIFWGSHLVKQGVNMAGPRILGVPVTLEHARFRPLSGHLSLQGLFVGNPEGFHTEGLFYVDQLEVDLDMTTLFSDPIVIDRIVIAAPRVTYEMGLRRTNLGTLLKQLEPPDDTDRKPEKDPADPKEAKSVLIRELVLADTRVEVSGTAMRGRVVPIRLSTITLNNLGGDDQSLTQIISQVLNALMGAIVNAIGDMGNLLGDGGRAVLDGAAGGVRSSAGTATEGLRSIGGRTGDRIRGLSPRRRAAGEENGE